ncbi:molybdate ABC transporter substrate-binding protein [Cognatishimia sp. D5M38]|uniref:Molybdate ABC transporter substrate-binding protein n=1 Tax=Cognatishimia coralii TaxID=3083254 RepID=A0ABU8QE44_9RHOB
MLRFLSCIFFLVPTVALAEITVFAAASLRGVLDEIHASAPIKVTTSYASSAALARQIVQGAPADVFFSANQLWATWLDDQAVTETFTAQDILRNELVVIASEADPDFDIATLPETLGEGFLAVGHTRAVPAGIYAKEALSSLRLWDELQDRIIQTDNVRAALRLVALGEAPFAVTYATDALADPAVHVVHRFDKEDHSPIIYRVAQLTKGEAANTYLDLLQSPAARDIFRAHGFQDIAP